MLGQGRQVSVCFWTLPIMHRDLNTGTYTAYNPHQVKICLRLWIPACVLIVSVKVSSLTRNVLMLMLTPACSKSTQRRFAAVSSRKTWRVYSHGVPGKLCSVQMIMSTIYLRTNLPLGAGDGGHQATTAVPRSAAVPSGGVVMVCNHAPLTTPPAVRRVRNSNSFSPFFCHQQTMLMIQWEQTLTHLLRWESKHELYGARILTLILEDTKLPSMWK